MSTVTIEIPYLDRWYFSSVHAGAAEAITEAGHEVRTRVHAPGPDARAGVADELVRDLAEPDVIGAIVTGFHLTQEQARAVLALRKPLVAIGGAEPGFPTVMIDDIAGSRIATEHLLKLGHRRILHLGGERATQMDFAVHGRRRKGYAVAMANAGLPEDVTEVPFDPSAAFAAVTAALDRDDRPTAIFAVSDEMALPAMEAIRAAGLEVGDDVSVVGFDDHPSAEPAGLTTVRQDPRAQGAAAAALLLARVAEGAQGDHGSRLMHTAIVERTSARRPSLLRMR